MLAALLATAMPSAQAACDAANCYTIPNINYDPTTSYTGWCPKFVQSKLTADACWPRHRPSPMSGPHVFAQTLALLM